MNFETNIPRHTIKDGEHEDNLLFPFGPPIYQTHISDHIHFLLLNEAKKLNIEEHDHNKKLAGNLFYGRSYRYTDDFVNTVSPYLQSKLEKFAKMYIDHGGATLKTLNDVVYIPHLKENGRLVLDNLWVNFQKQHDFNPIHNHSGKFSFVIYLKVPEKIFEVNADCNAQNAGAITFHCGVQTHPFDRTLYQVTPYDKLMLIFPSSLNHEVPSFWVDEERISVSGNFEVSPK